MKDGKRVGGLWRLFEMEGFDWSVEVTQQVIWFLLSRWLGVTSWVKGWLDHLDIVKGIDIYFQKDLRLGKKCTTFVRYKKLYDGYNNGIANDHGSIYSMMYADDHGGTNAVTILRCV